MKTPDVGSRGAWTLAGLNIVLTLGLCLLAGWAGLVWGQGGASAGLAR